MLARGKLDNVAAAASVAGRRGAPGLGTTRTQGRRRLRQRAWRRLQSMLPPSSTAQSGWAAEGTRYDGRGCIYPAGLLRSDERPPTTGPQDPQSLGVCPKASGGAARPPTTGPFGPQSLGVCPKASGGAARPPTTGPFGPQSLGICPKASGGANAPPTPPRRLLREPRCPDRLPEAPVWMPNVHHHVTSVPTPGAKFHAVLGESVRPDFVDLAAGRRRLRKMAQHMVFALPVPGGCNKFQPGNLVEIHSLAKSKELNGRGGEVLEYHAEARRYSVRIMVVDEVKAIKEENLRMHSGGDWCRRCIELQYRCSQCHCCIHFCECEAWHFPLPEEQMAGRISHNLQWQVGESRAKIERRSRRRRKG